MPKLGDVLNSINVTKDADLINEYNKSDYVPFLINRGMSFYPDTILHANTMNEYSLLDKELQYKYYIYSVRKKKRFTKWLSSSKPPEKLKIIANYYKISLKKAKSIVDMISKEDLLKMKQFLDPGGVKNS
jgi:hypothetical protein